ncbi:MAG: sigma-54-dependent Fis family transcriptional regulator [Deltaproteobacteria bacterium]|nr:sigma-54-dependent Fis family transcriptional regulator [Deltaproteobacteria bacterium]
MNKNGLSETVATAKSRGADSLRANVEASKSFRVESASQKSLGLRDVQRNLLDNDSNKNRSGLESMALRENSSGSYAAVDLSIHVPVEFEGMLGVSLPMLEIFQQIMEAALHDIPVLITGETGTGKDLVASAIHKQSGRKDKPYVAVNTGAMPTELIASELFGHEKGAFTGALETRKGRFEEANGGTIFLDEISTMDERAQVTLLRVLETKTFRRVGGDKDICVDVRIIAATNEALENGIKEKKFREDLYYRLDVFHIHLPPLRERPGGAVTVLTNHFLSQFNAAYNKAVKVVSPEVYRALRRYRWPGNVRELKNVIQRAVLVASNDELTLDLLPARIRAGRECKDFRRSAPPIHLGMTLEAVEREFIKLTLVASRGNKKETASRLGISRRALYNKLNRHGLL